MALGLEKCPHLLVRTLGLKPEKPINLNKRERVSPVQLDKSRGAASAAGLKSSQREFMFVSGGPRMGKASLILKSRMNLFLALSLTSASTNLVVGVELCKAVCLHMALAPKVRVYSVTVCYWAHSPCWVFGSLSMKHWLSDFQPSCHVTRLPQGVSSKTFQGPAIKTHRILPGYPCETLFPQCFFFLKLSSLHWERWEFA